MKITDRNRNQYSDDRDDDQHFHQCKSVSDSFHYNPCFILGIFIRPFYHNSAMFATRKLHNWKLFRRGEYLDNGQRWWVAADDHGDPCPRGKPKKATDFVVKPVAWFAVYSAENGQKITVTQSKGTVWPLFISVVLPTLLRQLFIGAVCGWRPV